MPTIEHGLYYHIYNRGINGTNLFRKKDDYSHFLSLFEKYICLVADTYAYCLMGNHFHMLVRIKDENEIGFLDFSKRFSENEKWVLINSPTNTNDYNENCQRKPVPYRQFSHLFNAYSKYFNFKYKRTGSLFEKNFHRIEINSERYFRQLVYYIHQNPVKHGIVGSIHGYQWSSYLSIIDCKPSEIQQKLIPEWFDDVSSFIAFHNGNYDTNEISQLPLPLPE